MTKKFIIVAAARPNFMKISPLIAEIKRVNKISRHLLKKSSRRLTKNRPITQLTKYPITYKLVHTGQHYDYQMSGSFFKELNIPKPDYNLGVKAGLHGEQTGKTMIEFEKVCLKEKPDLVIVVGDVNATLACALTAAKLHIKVAHIEAGLRSKDMSMPEEINRILTDHVSDYLFITEYEANKNLIKEGINKKKIFFVGDIMVDSLKNQKSKIKNKKHKLLKQFDLKPKQYAFLTMHRPSNVDDKKILTSLLETFNIISQKLPIIFPIHPRTKNRIKEFGLNNKLKNKNIVLTSPLSYLETVCLMINACLLITDSGGIQQETTSLSVPCLTIRENTERPITITQGTNVLCGHNRRKILKETDKILSGKQKKSKIPKYWDGKSAKRIIKALDNKILT
ncbi:MAG: UDP-N-acetylglucosamine 2-epimerase (non-hydrolyzing) [Patescibacteria group bacterium]|nr:UDP-N-acetylglucosamine 2-epimerase (non-hydrolyzing) [Patescibacteria group bacterium]